MPLQVISPIAPRFLSMETSPSIGAGTRIFVDVLTCLIHRQFRFVPFLVSEHDRSLARSCVRLEVLFELRQNPLGLFQGELILLGLDHTHEFVFLDVQLCPPHAKPGFEQRHFVLSCLNAASAIALVISSSACISSERFCSSL